MINLEQAKVLAQIIMDYADNNLNNWESFADETPQGARDIYNAAKALNDLMKELR